MITPGYIRKSQNPSKWQWEKHNLNNTIRERHMIFFYIFSKKIGKIPYFQPRPVYFSVVASQDCCEFQQQRLYIWIVSRMKHHSFTCVHHRESGLEVFSAKFQTLGLSQLVFDSHFHFSVCLCSSVSSSVPWDPNVDGYTPLICVSPRYLDEA